MDGVTDIAYRTLTSSIFDRWSKDGEELWLWTEFMNADGYMITPHKLVKHLLHVWWERKHPTIAQIYGWNTESLVKTAQDIEKKYTDFAGVELNIGCPSPKVIACGGGSWMLRDKQQTLETIRAISQSLSLPFSIKTRAGLTDDDRDEQYDFLCEAMKYCQTISVHARTMKQGHRGDVDWDMLYRLKEYAWPDVNIIGNGGVMWYQDGMHKRGNLDGQMIGQAAIGNPRALVDHEPDLDEVYEVAVVHLLLMCACEQYFLQTNYEETGDAVLHNRQAMHLLKKIQKNDDVAFDLPPLHSHDFVLRMPQPDELMTLAQDIITDMTAYDSLHSPIQYRKYILQYITWYEGNKERKQKICQQKTLNDTLMTVREYFTVLWSQSASVPVDEVWRRYPLWS